MLQLDLLALEKAHQLTGHGNNDVEWAYGVLAATRTEEAATPAVMIFLRTLPPGTTAWKIPEQIHSRDLLPHYAGLAKRVAIRDARLALYDRWTAEDKAAQAAAAQRAKVEAFSAACAAQRREENAAALAAWRATPEQQQRMRELEQLRLPEEAEAEAAQKEAQETFMAVTGRSGMAEAAGWQAHDAVSRHGLSAAEAVQQAIRTLSMWTWATPEARAKKAQEEQEEHDPVLERLIAESKAIREAPLSAFAADAGLEDEEVETQPVAQEHNPILERVKALQAETRATREALGLDEDGYEGEPIPWDR
jgi:hypothetical protein